MNVSGFGFLCSGVECYLYKGQGSRKYITSIRRKGEESYCDLERKWACVQCGCSHLRSDLDCGDVCLPVHVSHHGLVRVTVMELHAQLGPPCHRGSCGYHVSVGHNHPWVGHKETRAAGEPHVAAKQRMSGDRERKEWLFFYSLTHSQRTPQLVNS